MYVANHNSQSISAFTADSNGALTPVSGSPFQTTSAVSSLAINSSGMLLYAAAYDAQNAGTVWGFTISPGTGVLKPVSNSPVAVPCIPLSLVFSPNGSYLFVACWNLRLISVFSVDSGTGVLTQLPNSPFFAGGSQRILAMHPSGNFLFGADDSDDTILVYSLSSSGVPTQIAGTYFSDMNRPWGIALDPSGTHLFAANEQSVGSADGFAVGSNGSLTLMANSPFAISAEPLSITVAPSGKFAYTANFFANNVSALSLDGTTGALSELAMSPFTTGSGSTSPSAIAFDSTGKFAYVANTGTNNLAAFSVDSSGNLTPLGGSPFVVGTGPVAVVTTVGKP